MASTSCFLHHLHALTRSPSQLRHTPTHVQLMKPNQIVCRSQKQAPHDEDYTAGSAVSRRLALTVLIGAAAVGSKVSPADAAYGEAEFFQIIIKPPMGSLMAGWASHVPDPKAVKYQRNWSLTREEIDTYWKSKKEKEEEHDAKVVSEEIPIILKESERSRSVPLAADTKGSFLDMENDDDKASLVKLILKNGWWTSSSSAFLNEPPVIASSEERYNKYASQFHVAAGASETNA